MPCTLGPPARVSVYELTDAGRELEPVVIALGRWGRRLAAPAGAAHGTDSLVLALKWRFDPEAAGDLSATYGLRMAGDGFRIGVADGQMEVQRGEPERPDSLIETDPQTLERVTFDGGDAAEAERSGALRLAGDRRLAPRLLGLYAPAP